MANDQLPKGDVFCIDYRHKTLLHRFDSEWEIFKCRFPLRVDRERSVRLLMTSTHPCCFLSLCAIRTRSLSSNPASPAPIRHHLFRH